MLFIQYHKSKSATWFRIFGYGFCFRNIKKSKFSLTFSERQGSKKYIQIFGYIITILKPYKL